MGVRRISPGSATFAPRLSGLQACRVGRKRYREQRRLDFRPLARVSCSSPRCSWRRSGVPFWRNGFGDDQPPAAAGAWQREDAGKCIGVTSRVIVRVTLIRCFGPEQFPDPGDIGGTVTIPKEAVVADAMLPLGQDMDQEPADELAGLEGHLPLLPAGIPLHDPFATAAGSSQETGGQRMNWSAKSAPRPTSS